VGEIMEYSVIEESSESGVFWNWKTALKIYVIVVLLMVFVGSFLQLLNLYIGMVISELLIAGPVLVYLYRKKADMSVLGITFDKGLLKDFVYAVIGFVVGYPLATIAAVLTEYILGPSPFGELYADLLTPKSMLDLIIWLAIMGFAVAPCEEIFARGFVQQGMENSFGKTKGLIIASILFGALHMDPWRIPATATLGLVFGYIYQKRNYRLTAPIITHFLNNAFIIVLLYLIYTGSIVI